MVDTLEEMLSSSGVADDNEETEQDESTNKLTELERKIDALSQNNNATVEALRAANRDKEELVKNYSTVVGFIEGSNIGKMDPETGKIVRYEHQVDEVTLLENKIKEIDANLRKQFEDEDITEAEYWRKLEEQRSPLKDQLYDLRTGRQVDRVKKEIMESMPQSKPEASKSISEKFTEIVQQYPDISNNESPLFKEMDRIFRSNPEVWGNVNPGTPDKPNPNANPGLYKELARQASELLEARGVTIQKARAANVNGSFSSPENSGYEREQKPKSNLDRNDLNLLVGQGFTNKTLITEINEAMGKWDQTGVLTLKD